MHDLSEMIRKLAPKAGTGELDQWETDIVESLVLRLNSGQVSEIHPRQRHALTQVYERVFGKQRRAAA